MYKNKKSRNSCRQMTINNPQKRTGTLSFEDNSYNSVSQKHLVSLLHFDNGTLQREKIPIPELLTYIENIPFGEKQKICLASTNLLIHGHIPLQYISDRLNWLNREWTFPPNRDNQYNALLLSSAVDAVGELMAYAPEINLPRLRPELTEALLLGFKDQLIKLTEEDNIKFAASLNHKDPIELYIKQVLSLGASAQMVVEMATTSGIDSIDFFELLLLQFQSRMNAFNPELIGANEIPDVKGDANYNPKDMTGFISVSFLNYVKGGPGYKADGYILSKTMDQSISELREEVKKINQLVISPLVPAFVQSYPGSIRYICATLKCSEQTARDLLPRINDCILNCPIQVSIKAKDWFNDQGIKTSPNYKSMLELMHKKIPKSEVIASGMEGEITMLNMEDEDFRKGRGVYYPSWRWDKDTRSENRDLDFSEFPVHGALCFWDSSELSYGVDNIYGDIHLRLSPNFAHNRQVSYKSHATGILCHTPLDLFNELAISNSLSCYAAVFLGKVVGCPVSSCPNTNLEVIIAGGFNVEDDVQEILTPHTTPTDSPHTGLASWSLSHHIDQKKAPADLSDRISRTECNGAGYQEYLLGKKLSDHTVPLAKKICDILQHPIWKGKGATMFTRPKGIQEMRKIPYTTDLLYLETLQSLAKTRQTTSPNTPNRDTLTQEFYTLLSQIDILKLQLSLSQFTVLFERL